MKYILLNHRDPAALQKWVLKTDAWVSGTAQCYWVYTVGLKSLLNGKRIYHFVLLFFCVSASDLIAGPFQVFVFFSFDPCC